MEANKPSNQSRRTDELLRKEVPSDAEEKSEIEDIILHRFCKGESANDCTGLIPKMAPQESRDNYLDVYPYGASELDIDKTSE